MKILLIRHGQTEVNRQGVTHKTGDPAILSALGKKQATSLVSVCHKNNLQSIYSSPELRAVETAEIIAKGISKPVTIIDGLKERNWGAWEGKPWEEIRKVLDPMDLQQRYTFMPPSGESWEQMDGRLKKSIERIVTDQKEAIAIVTHEGALRAMVTLLSNAPKESSFKLHFDNASVTVFEYKNRQFALI